MTSSERAHAQRYKIIRQGDRIVVKSAVYTSGERNPTLPRDPIDPAMAGKLYMIGEDARLPDMPAAPTLLDFFKYRFSPSSTHLLQTARQARKAGQNEKVILACLLHDIAIMGFIRADHGYWGAQMIEPYVDEEVSWAVRAHQALRFYPDESVGYSYPQNYIKYFGPNYRPDPYIEEEYARARAHKWYMTGRLVTLYDDYERTSKDVGALEDFTDIIGRNFKQPKEGLGFDNERPGDASVAHHHRAHEISLVARPLEKAVLVLRS
jgi:hypothetical protein